MTSEERNRRAKHGHDVPRSWIPDFNVTPAQPADGDRSDELISTPSVVDEDLLKALYARKRRSRGNSSRQLLRRRVNSDIRIFQKVMATLIVLAGFPLGGVVGLAIGVILGLALLSLRLEL